MGEHLPSVSEALASIPGTANTYTSLKIYVSLVFFLSKKKQTFNINCNNMQVLMTHWTLQQLCQLANYYLYLFYRLAN
jgi:hypothetical protein